MATNETPIDQLTYEQAFRELEALVQNLENDQLALEETSSLFERGQALVRRCSALLEAADLRIRSLQTSSPETPGEAR